MEKKLEADRNSFRHEAMLVTGKILRDLTELALLYREIAPDKKERQRRIAEFKTELEIWRQRIGEA